MTTYNATFLIVDQDNPNKAHHIKFANGSVFYNQAINADNSRAKPRGDTFEAHGSEWFDFYVDEEVLDSEFHGYRAYINKAKELLEEAKDLDRVPFTHAEIKSAVANARDNAKAIARKWYPFIRSRGASIAIYDENGEKVTEEGQIEFDSLKALKKVIAEHPNLTALSIAGGYDGADNMTDLNEGFVEPWLSEWCVDLIVDGVWQSKPRIFAN